ncbi:MAG TPA: DUF6496 domain-containing protein [Candidatus Babeliales bacterium]|nr:DUF6496 domain-containing protein [Candidatus Babeliales bacterium]
MTTKAATKHTKRTTATKKHTKNTGTKETSKKSTTERKYSPSSQKSVAKEMHKFKEGTAKSGKAGTPVKSREQAIAIGLSKARAKGAKVPNKASKE